MSEYIIAQHEAVEKFEMCREQEEILAVDHTTKLNGSAYIQKVYLIASLDDDEGVIVEFGRARLLQLGRGRLWRDEFLAELGVDRAWPRAAAPAGHVRPGIVGRHLPAGRHLVPLGHERTPAILVLGRGGRVVGLRALRSHGGRGRGRLSLLLMVVV